MPFDFDKIADDFDATRSADPRLIDAVSMGIYDLLGKGSTLLDIGTGTGRFLLPLDSIGIKGIGIDISSKMLLKAKEKHLHSLIRGDASKLPFIDCQFDASLITGVLHLVDDWKGVIREACRVSKKAVLAVDVERDDSHPHMVFRKIMRERGVPIPQKGPFENDICESCVPEKHLHLTSYVELKKRDDLISTYNKKSFTFQSDIDEVTNRDLVKEMEEIFQTDVISINWNISLIVWDPERLTKDIERTTFRYPQ